MDKLKKILCVNQKVFVFLIGLMIVAVLFGSSLPLFLNGNDKSLVTEYLANFVNQVKDGVDFIFLLKNGLIGNFSFLIFIWLLGISVIGIPIVLFLFFSKCFVFGFSISSIIINYGFKGLLFSFGYIFPHLVINIFIYGLLASYSLIFSIKLIGLILKKYDFNIRVSFNKYFKVFLLCSCILLISVIYESFINPYVLKFIFNLLGL